MILPECVEYQRYINVCEVSESGGQWRRRDTCVMSAFTNKVAGGVEALEKEFPHMVIRILDLPHLKGFQLPITSSLMGPVHPGHRATDWPNLLTTVTKPNLALVYLIDFCLFVKAAITTLLMHVRTPAGPTPPLRYTGKIKRNLALPSSGKTIPYLPHYSAG